MLLACSVSLYFLHLRWGIFWIIHCASVVSWLGHLCVHHVKQLLSSSLWTLFKDSSCPIDHSCNSAEFRNHISNHWRRQSFLLFFIFFSEAGVILFSTSYVLPAQDSKFPCLPSWDTWTNWGSKSGSWFSITVCWYRWFKSWKNYQFWFIWKSERSSICWLPS